MGFHINPRGMILSKPLHPNKAVMIYLLETLYIVHYLVKETHNAWLGCLPSNK